VWIKTVKDLMFALRMGNYAWPGGYPLFFLTADRGALHPNTVRSELWQIARAVRDKDNAQWRVIACDVNWEDSELYDAHTNEKIEAAYA